MGLLDSMKSEINKSGGNKKKILFVREGNKKRIRFLADFEDGVEVMFHDSFAKSVNAACRVALGEKTCPYCGDEELRDRNLYGWPVYDYDENEVKLFLFAVNNCTPIPALISMYETYGTLLDRDYVIERKGKQQNTSYSCIPMDKAKFKSKVKIPSKAAIFNIIGKAFPAESESDFEDSEEMSDNDYNDLSPKDLYSLCKSRNIECKPKNTAAHYISLLEKDDIAQTGDGDDDWDPKDDDDEDDW